MVLIEEQKKQDEKPEEAKENTSVRKWQRRKVKSREDKMERGNF